MYATNETSTILGVLPGDIEGRSFYEFIQEDYLNAAALYLERTKENDSLAYLRFWNRDHSVASATYQAWRLSLVESIQKQSHPLQSPPHLSSVDETSEGGAQSWKANRDPELMPTSETRTSTASLRSSSILEQSKNISNPKYEKEPLEIEGVVSCTSDGLLVVLRRARPLIPGLQEQLMTHRMETGRVPHGA